MRVCDRCKTGENVAISMVQLCDIDGGLEHAWDLCAECRCLIFTWLLEWLKAGVPHNAPKA